MTMSMTLLPPSWDVCQLCAVEHTSDQPHDCDALYYQMRFQMEHGRPPTWSDALAHCSDRAKDMWRTALMIRQVWTEHPTPIKETD